MGPSSKKHLNKHITFQVNLIVPLFDKCHFFCCNKLATHTDICDKITIVYGILPNEVSETSDGLA